MRKQIASLIAAYYAELHRIGPALDEIHEYYRAGFVDGDTDCELEYAYEVGCEHGAIDAEYHTIERVIRDLEKITKEGR